jgi:hypothetical protein
MCRLLENKHPKISALFNHSLSRSSEVFLMCYGCSAHGQFYVSNPYSTQYLHFWFQTFAVFWMLYASFWVIPRHLNFIRQRLGTLCLFHLNRWVGMKMEQRECSEMLAYKIQTPGNYPEESIQQFFTLHETKNWHTFSWCQSGWRWWCLPLSLNCWGLILDPVEQAAVKFTWSATWQLYKKVHS